MGIFGKKQPPVQPPPPANRTIPTLEPEYFESIHNRLVANGGSMSSTEIAFGVGNAIFNTGSNYLHQTHAFKAMRDFEALYGDRSPQDRGAADRMIDFLITHDSSVQVGEGGFLTTLLGRLDDVLSRPAQSGRPSTTTDANTEDPIQANTLRLITALSFLTDQSTIGQPFGEGTGLEVARSIVRNSFNSIDEARSGGFRLAISLIAENSIGPDDVTMVMGTDVIDRAGLTADQAEAARSLGGAARTFLGQINQEGANMWELWKKNDEVAEEFLCWHAVAWGRLETLGKVARL